MLRPSSDNLKFANTAEQACRGFTPAATLGIDKSKLDSHLGIHLRQRVNKIYIMQHFTC